LAPAGAAASLLHRSQQVFAPIAAAKRAAPAQPEECGAILPENHRVAWLPAKTRNIAPSGRRDEMSQIRRLAAILATVIRLHRSIERYAGDAGALGEQIFLSPSQTYLKFRD